MASKPKPIASTDEPIDLPTAETAHEPITPLPVPIAPAPEGHLLRSARAQMESELTQLQTTLDSLSDDYADRAETMVRDWLAQCRSKAKSRINGIDLADFFDSGDELPPQTVNVPALASSEM
jgi:hypothetical protein